MTMVPMGGSIAGDGLFTASVKSGVPGKFQVLANIEGTSARGTAFQRTTYTTFKVNSDKAHFAGSFTSCGIDTDSECRRCIDNPKFHHFSV